MLPAGPVTGLLVVAALIGGFAAAALGPGGVLLVGLFGVVTALSPAEVAGTASAIFLPGSVVGAVMYVRSKDMDWRLAAIVGTTAVLGTQVGARLNVELPPAVFDGALAGLLFVAALLVAITARSDVPSLLSPGRARTVLVAAIGGGVGIAGGFFGVGGPVFAVPLLAAIGIPMLTALAVAQVQAALITAATAATYGARGAVDLELVGVLLVPFLVGIVAGWRFAIGTSQVRLKQLLAAALVAVGVGVVL